MKLTKKGMILKIITQLTQLAYGGRTKRNARNFSMTINNLVLPYDLLQHVTKHRLFAKPKCQENNKNFMPWSKSRFE